MLFRDLFQEYSSSTEKQMQAVFTSIFVLQNRLQTACDKVDTDITMKQWLLLAMVDSCGTAPTLTELGGLMGCSRQNVKKLALVLEKRGFIEITQSSKNASASSILMTEKAKEHNKKMGYQRFEVLTMLFHNMGENEIRQLYDSIGKLQMGMDYIEKSAEKGYGNVSDSIAALSDPGGSKDGKS